VTENYSIQLLESQYVFFPNHTYQIFSNSKLGGGVLKKGNVQEEKLMLTFSVLQYLMYDFHHNTACTLSNDLSVNPIVIDTMVIVKDNSYVGYSEPSMSINYGTMGLLEACDKNKANALFTEIDTPIPIKALCVAMPDFFSSETRYDHQVLHTMFETLYKSFVVSIEANEKNVLCLEINLHIGNIGCGAFGHNYCTIYLLQLLALGYAIKCRTPLKKINVFYHTYSKKTHYMIMEHAVPVMKKWNSSNSYNYSDCLSELRQYQLSNPAVWQEKLI